MLLGDVAGNYDGWQHPPAPFHLDRARFGGHHGVDRSSRTQGILTMGSTRRSFTPEYQKDAVALIVDGGHTIVEVAKKLEISETSIRKWVKKIQPPTEPVPEKQLNESERAELARLRRENAKLEMQLEFAKKVSSWFAKGQQ